MDLGPYLEIHLTRGKIAKVSPGDYPTLMQWRWSYNGDDSPYATRTFRRNGKKHKVYMHRQIVQTARGVLVNHRNGDTLDCRRPNLVPTTARRNSTVEKVKRGRLGYFGVWPAHRVRSDGSVATRFRASITVGPERIYLGSHEAPEDAARAYDHAAVEAFGCQAETNFPLTDYFTPVTLLHRLQQDPGPIPF